MSPNFFVLLVLALIAFIDKSESLNCYQCNSLVDGDDCHNAVNLKDVDCGDLKHCAKITGMLSVVKITGRGCSNTVCDETMTEGLTSATCSTCTTNLCNGSGFVKSTMFGSFLIIFIGALVSNKFV